MAQAQAVYILFQKGNGVGQVYQVACKRQANLPALLAQQLPAERVKRADPYAVGAIAHSIPQARVHLFGGFVREGEGENVFGRDAPLSQQKQDAGDQRTRLARSRPGVHKCRPLDNTRRCPLTGIQAIEIKGD